MTLEPRNERLLGELELFLVATEENLRFFELHPFDVALREENRFDPLRLASHEFLELLCRLDEATFGPQGMPMPRWIFLDGGELTGGIVGLGRRAPELGRDVRELIRPADGYAGLVPLSMYIAIPSVERATWVGHNLASIAGRLSGGELRGLGRLTKSLALKLFRAETQVGASQWDSIALHVHTKLGPLEAITAWTPAHSKPWTLTYRARIDDASLRHLAGDPRGAVEAQEPELWLRSDDFDAMQELQERLELGQRLRVVGPPHALEEGVQRIPLARG
jgi:hypothetical protein